MGRGLRVTLRVRAQGGRGEVFGGGAISQRDVAVAWQRAMAWPERCPREVTARRDDVMRPGAGPHDSVVTKADWKARASLSSEQQRGGARGTVANYRPSPHRGAAPEGAACSLSSCTGGNPSGRLGLGTVKPHGSAGAARPHTGSLPQGTLC